MGVRQGENLSPFLFSIFLNDLEEFMLSKEVNCVTTVNENIETELGIYLKQFLLLYTDDTCTALRSESAEDLQLQINAFGEFCDNWKMKVNIDKTKVMVFGLGKIKTTLKFFYKTDEIEIIDEFNYLGVNLTKTLNFNITKKHLADKALRAMYEVLKLGRLHKLSVQIHLDLFDKMVKPILLYV